LSQLFATEELFTGIDGATIMQNTERGHGGADIDHCDRQLIMRSAQLRLHQTVGTLQSVRLDVHYFGGQAGERQRSLTDFDVLLDRKSTRLNSSHVKIS